jgi:ABC-2 type transport system ATP-binding protein
MAIIVFNTVSKFYRKHFWKEKITAVSNLSFSVPENGITGFIGPNGAGKTTSIKMLLGIIKPSVGTISIRGKNPWEPAARKRVSYISEQPYFYAYLTVRETLSFLYKLQQHDPAKQKQEIRKVIDLVQLQGHESKKIIELSKGMQQRLNLAQALMGEPDLFIFDEPMSGLDPLGRKLFRDVFRKLALQKKCIFFSTHILEDIETICDNVVVLSQGTLAFSGAIAEIENQGVLGAEITVPSLTTRDQIILMEKGYGISTLDTGPLIIFIPTPHNPRDCQKYLYQQNIFPLSIHIRRRSIESFLYDHKQEKLP